MFKIVIIVTFSFCVTQNQLGIPLAKATATTNFTALEYENNVQKALAWLISHRDEDWGWGEHTAKVLLAFQLAPIEDIKPVLLNQAEVDKSTRKLETETLLSFEKYEKAQVDVLKLAQNGLTFIAFCQNLTDFHGHDVLSELQRRTGLSGTELAYISLVECSAGAYITNYRIQQLLNTIGNSEQHQINTLALTILSLRCISQDERYSHLQYSLKKPIVNLARQQQADGGFGNLQNTALIIWALQNASEANNHWNKSDAVSYIESTQDQIVDPELMSDAILALSSKLPWAIRRLNCRKGEDHEVTLGKPNYLYHTRNLGRNVSVTYTLWIGTDVTENHTLELTVRRGSSFYRVMQGAMEKDPKFAFEASQWSFGHYIQTLGGHTEDRVRDIYWLLYRTPEVPDPATASDHFLASAVGVDGLLAEEGDHYLFWYRKL